MMAPETLYARSGDLNIAYQVTGEGARDLVYVPGWVSNIELMWEEPAMARFLDRLASFSRLILFDKRGTGLSDRVSNNELPTLAQRMDVVRAVLLRMNSYIDVREVLPTIRVPTLVLHRTGDHDVNVAEGRYLASRIPGAKFVELAGADHWISAGDTDAIADEIEEFLTGTRPT